MTNEDKELLLKELCARLPYGVKGIITYDKSEIPFILEGIDNNILHLSESEECYIEDFKPYLRPISSMTLKEKVESDIFLTDFIDTIKYIDWLNAHHFDFRGLIEKGLALLAPEGMYNK